MCYGVNTCLVLIMHISGRHIGSGSRVCICFLSAFVPTFNVNHPECPVCGAIFKNTPSNQSALCSTSCTEYGHAFILVMSTRAHWDQSVFNYLKAVMSVKVHLTTFK